MRKTKKWLALLLAACMAIPNVAGYAATDVSVVQAAEETAKRKRYHGSTADR